MAKGDKGSKNSVPVDDNTSDVTAEVADAMVSEGEPQEEAKVETDLLETDKDQAADSSLKEETTESQAEESSKKSKVLVSAKAGNISVAAEANEEVISKPIKNAVKVKPKTKPLAQAKKGWGQNALIVSGLVLTVLIFVAGGFSQLYKGKVLPNVSVAGINSSSKNQMDLQKQIEAQIKDFKVTIKAGKTELKPDLKEIGYFVDTKKTAEEALNAKRKDLFSRFLFWQKTEIPVNLTVNTTLLSQYVENKLPSLTNAGKDARLEYDTNQESFVVTAHKNGTGPNAVKLKAELEVTADNLKSKTFTVATTKKPAKITEEKLQGLISKANDITRTSVILEGSAGTFQAQPSDIALWITPTPQTDGSVKLAIDEGKVESYVEALSNQISSTPQDKKVIKDKKTGKLVVLQEGRDGTELADRATLANKITQALNNNQPVSLTMNIKTAKAKTVNLQGYDKWIEVDLSKQTATAYEGATALHSYLIASGLAGYDTPTGEYAIWLKVRSQTMVGGSKADGSYYNLPNVEWVSYFYQDYALHGAYWRKVFGVPGSHGCVNMTNADAQWVYNWAPVGTKVIVHY